MFSYYGSKSKIINYYPPPKYGKVIEPFAGSARYALKYFDRDITIVEKNKQIFDIWVYLKSATENDIKKLPKLTKGEQIKELNLSDVEKDFLGMMFGNAGSSSPCYSVSSFGDYRLRGDSLGIVAKNLFKIRGWEIINGDCFDLPNIEATWFIDPPYQFGGEHYKFGNKQLNFTELAEWCKSRLGQTIVCENTKADWLPFVPITKIYGASNKFTTEAIWSNYKTNYDNVQMGLF